MDCRDWTGMEETQMFSVRILEYWWDNCECEVDFRPFLRENRRRISRFQFSICTKNYFLFFMSWVIEFFLLFSFQDLSQIWISFDLCCNSFVPTWNTFINSFPKCKIPIRVECSVLYSKKCSPWEISLKWKIDEKRWNLFSTLSNLYHYMQLVILVQINNEII